MEYEGPNRRHEPSNADIYHVLGQLQEGVKQMHKKQDTTNGRVLASEQRLNAVERRQSWFMGGIAAIGAGVGFITAFLKLD